MAYGSHLSGRTLAACARREGRLLLTRDTRLVRHRHCPPHVFVTSNDFRDQLRQVAAAVPLDGAALLGRCLTCNRAVEPVPRDTVRERVPPYVFATQERFHRCPGCDRLFWAATHRTHVLAELAALGLTTEGPA